MKQYVAPLQGFTEAPWRNAHHEIFGGADAYYTPFVRLEHGEFRSKDVRDVSPENNAVPHLVPQLIASKPDELARLAELFCSMGYRKADINLGCPFPLMTGKHKGSGILPHPDEVRALLDELPHHPDVKFSIKMRLGLENVDEWRALLPMLNAAPLERIVLHPRIGRQQYKGTPDREAFASFYEACAHPLVYNGDVQSVEDAYQLMSDFPRLEGIMLGRGLLARPSLAVEIKESRAWSDEELYNKVLVLHNRLLQHYEGCLQGEAQLLSKLKPYWEYLLPDMDKKVRKAIKKAVRMDKYLAAVRMVCPRTY